MCSSMRFCGLPVCCRDAAGPWERLQSQSKNIGVFLSCQIGRYPRRGNCRTMTQAWSTYPWVWLASRRSQRRQVSTSSVFPSHPVKTPASFFLEVFRAEHWKKTHNDLVRIFATFSLVFPMVAKNGYDENFHFHVMWCKKKRALCFRS